LELHPQGDFTSGKNLVGPKIVVGVVKVVKREMTVPMLENNVRPAVY
jgi:hypothetical protein